jgi:protein SCO1/2
MFPRPSNPVFAFLAGCIALLSLAAGISLWRLHEAEKLGPLESLVLLPEPRVIADFALTDQAGNPFSLEDLKGHWSLLFFGYTSCPDVCPNTLFQLQQARQLMLQQETAENIPQVYLVSVDFERDTPQKLAEYLKYFDPSFIGLRGEEPQMRALTLQLGVAYFIEPHEENSLEYQVDHSASLLLINPQGQLRGVLPAPHEAAGIAQDVMTVIRQEGSAPWP